jgi:hypothetical protein
MHSALADVRFDLSISKSVSDAPNPDICCQLICAPDLIYQVDWRTKRQADQIEVLQEASKDMLGPEGTVSVLISNSS